MEISKFNEVETFYLYEIFMAYVNRALLYGENGFTQDEGLIKLSVRLKLYFFFSPHMGRYSF